MATNRAMKAAHSIIENVKSVNVIFWDSPQVAVQLASIIDTAADLPALEAQAARVEELERRSCPHCDGQGWYEVTGSAHDPRCDGSCVHCPVPVPEQEQCQSCSGTGDILAAERDALQRRIDEAKALAEIVLPWVSNYLKAHEAASRLLRILRGESAS